MFSLTLLYFSSNVYFTHTHTNVTHVLVLKEQNRRACQQWQFSCTNKPLFMALHMTSPVPTHSDLSSFSVQNNADIVTTDCLTVGSWDWKPFLSKTVVWQCCVHHPSSTCYITTTLTPYIPDNNAVPLHFTTLLTLSLPTTTIVAPPLNVIKWQMGFNSAA
jgi:hypothetical protein